MDTNQAELDELARSLLLTDDTTFATLNLNLGNLTNDALGVLVDAIASNASIPTLNFQPLNGILTDEEYQSLPADVKQIIVTNAANTRILIQELGATFEQLCTLPATSLETVLTNPDSPEAQEIIADLPSQQQSTPGMSSGPG